MNEIKNRFCLLLLACSATTFCQQTILSSGGEALGSGSVSYSVGQVFFKTNLSSNGASLEGVQQNVELFVLSNPEVKNLALKAIVFPNPTQNKVNLVLENSDEKSIQYQIFDVRGVAVKKGNITIKNTVIDISKFAKGIYLLKVFDKKKPLKSFKILKK